MHPLPARVGPALGPLPVMQSHMMIQVHTDNRIHADENLRDAITAVVKSALSHLSGRISRVQIHLGDESGNKQTDDDKRCMMEARIDGLPPSAVTHHASSLTEAIDGAAEKLRHSLESILGKADDRRA